MKGDTNKLGITRRQFIISGLCVGGGLVLATGVASLRRAGGRSTTIVFRNPAYQMRQSTAGIVLECRTGGGETIAFHMDEPAALFWRQVPPAGAIGGNIRKFTIDEVIEAIAPKLDHQVKGDWRQDARDFAQEALRRGVLLPENARLRVAYSPPRTKR
jgi:hypothetical protein